MNAPTKTIPYFNFEVPTELPGVDTAILDPRDTYVEAAQWEKRQKILQGDLLRTLQNMKVTKMVRHLYLPDHSYKKTVVK